MQRSEDSYADAMSHVGKHKLLIDAELSAMKEKLHMLSIEQSVSRINL